MRRRDFLAGLAALPVLGRFLPRPEPAPALTVAGWADSNRIASNVSVGYRLLEVEETPVDGVLVATKWEPVELSVIPRKMGEACARREAELAWQLLTGR